MWATTVTYCSVPSSPLVRAIGLGNNSTISYTVVYCEATLLPGLLVGFADRGAGGI